MLTDSRGRALRSTLYLPERNLIFLFDKRKKIDTVVKMNSITRASVRNTLAVVADVCLILQPWQFNEL